MPERDGAGPRHGGLARFCDAVDRLNAVVGIVVGTSVVFVTAAIVWEVVARGLFGRPTIWANEATIYVSAVTYLVAGGYALLHHRHVRIDLVYAALRPRTRAGMDAVTLGFTLLYAGALVWLGGRDFLAAWRLGETTGTPWNPPIWPVKAAIPIAGALVALQAVVNTLRALGIVPPGRTRDSGRDPAS